VILAGAVVATAACVAALLIPPGPAGAATVWGVEVVREYPHDAGSFCQGLVFDRGQLYEGTGQYGASSLRRVELETGRVLQQVSLGPQFFGEGIAIWDDTLIQLTWRERRAFVFDRETLAHRHTWQYTGEGWGLTHDGKHLILSDGSSVLRFLDPGSFKEVRRLGVRDGRRPVRELNELEYVQGEIWANLWHTDRIARISPVDGRVVAWVDLSSLWPASQRPSREHVLNGIAADPATGRLFVTGKNWPRLYEIRLVPLSRP
jgi:glutamine cyclotransferase